MHARIEGTFSALFLSALWHHGPFVVSRARLDNSRHCMHHSRSLTLGLENACCCAVRNPPTDGRFACCGPAGRWSFLLSMTDGPSFHGQSRLAGAAFRRQGPGAPRLLCQVLSVRRPIGFVDYETACGEERVLLAWSGKGSSSNCLLHAIGVFSSLV